MDSSSFCFRFLRWFCPEHLYEEIEGDLIQRFEKDVKKYGERKAKRNLNRNVLRFFRPGIILRRKISVEVNSMSMMIAHLKFAIRYFLKDKFFSTLNVLGLALGISVGIILLLILQNDLTYDQHHTQHERIYRLGARQQMTGDDFSGAITARELGLWLQEEFPEIERVVRVETWGRTLVKLAEEESEEARYEENIIRTDSTFFQVFTHSFLAGNPSTCLTDQNAIVLTRSVAEKYFGDDEALNKTLLIDNSLRKVTAVIEDVPENSHLKFGMILSHLPDRSFKEKSESYWNPDVYTYLLVNEQFHPQALYDKFPAFYNRHLKFTGDRVGGKYTPILEPLASIHFHSSLQSDMPQGNLTNLYALTGIGILIILLACINYMNLSTAKSSMRAGEIAIKKTLGSGARSLTVSFFVESLLLSFLSLGVAIVLVVVVLYATPFPQLIGKTLSFDFFNNSLLLLGSLAIAVSIGLLSGLYPAIILPAIPAIKALKGNFKNGQQGSVLRFTSTGIQFIISIFTVACVLLMQDQIRFVSGKDLGFDKENILVLPLQDTLVKKQAANIKNDFLVHPTVVSVTTAESVMGMENTLQKWVMWAESDTGMKMQGFRVFFVGDDYLKTMGIKLLEGRDFQPGEKSLVFLANETAANAMGWKDAIGKKVRFYQATEDNRIIGVVKDFNFNSLHNPMEPTLICKIPQEDLGFIQVRVKGNLPEILNYAQEKWKSYGSKYPFEYFFIDQEFDKQYKADVQQGKLLKILSGICIFISLLGLIGLAAFQATRRIKEIGIRRVLGAKVSQIILLLSKEVLMTLLLAVLLATPITLWAITHWLEGFAYRMEIDYLIFVQVAGVSLCMIVLVVLIQSLKSAQANPIDSLKQE